MLIKTKTIMDTYDQINANGSNNVTENSGITMYTIPCVLIGLGIDIH
jgi:hypothetical protein